MNWGKRKDEQWQRWLSSTSAHKSQPWGFRVFWSPVYFCARDCSDFELQFCMWPEIGFKHFPSSFLPCACCDLSAGLAEGCFAARSRLSAGHFRPLWRRAEGFLDRSGAVPAHWPPECSLQEVCLMMKNLNSLDWRGKKIISNQNCRGNTLCFAFWQKTQHSRETLQMSWCLAASWDTLVSLTAPWKHLQLYIN